MSYTNPKITFYRTRTFGEKLNTSFEFIRETWKPILRLSFYLILPICLIQAMATNTYMELWISMSKNTSTDEPSSMFLTLIASNGALLLCILAGTSVMSGLVYTLMQMYENRETRLIGIRFADIKTLLIKNTRKLIGSMLLLFFLILFVVGILIGFMVVMTIGSPWTLLLTLPLVFVLIFGLTVPLSYFAPVYIFEDCSFSDALKKAFRYGFSAFIETFCVLIVLGFLSNIISGITTTPWYLVFFIGQLFSAASPELGLTSNPFFVIGSYLLGVLQAYGTYMSIILTITGFSFQYFHIREKHEGISVQSNIQQFEHL